MAVMDQSSDICLLYPHYFINSFISLTFIEPQLPESFNSEELWTLFHYWWIISTSFLCSILIYLLH